MNEAAVMTNATENQYMISNVTEYFGNTPPVADTQKEQEAAPLLEESEGVYIHKFKRPFEYGGTVYQEITFDFERLSGKDMLAIDMEMQMNNEFALTAEISRTMQCKLAAKAAGIGSDVLEAMPLSDFNRITNAARNFLLSTGY